ncbi:AAA family ATPase [Chryseobacterium sediminis]|uniref:AAA family ATPase n=1 Tax=Chryseobacterium sediminis TaxID=1679494 RepID=UPI002865E931|nr:AAA family ATPase [Chryseobacterium sediminis]MDR6466278.1 putative ATPase [Chryseobacterium sediminis]
MKQDISKFYIITGGPGAGKTTLLDELNQYGLTTVPEEGRRIIKEQIESGEEGLPWLNKELFAKLMFEESVKAYQKLNQSTHLKPVFFDRGIWDTLGYMRLENIHVPEVMITKASEMVYNNNVFMFPPWKEIYENDPERKQSIEKAILTFECIKEIYQEYGFNIIEIPKVTVKKRAAFILDRVLI